MKTNENNFGGVILINFIHMSFLLIPIWIFLKTDWARGVYSLTCLPTGQTTHAITILTLWFASMVYFRRMKYLYPLTRLVALMSILVFQIHFYDFIWSAQNWLFRRQPVNLFALIFFVVSFLFLIRIESLHTMFRTIPLVFFFAKICILMLIGFGGMAITGFWSKMALVDSGVLGIDPNQNVFWILSKIPSFFILFPFLDDRDIEAPLRLDPRVLTW